MSRVVGGLAGGLGEAALLAIISWVAVFGVMGALLARARGLFPVVGCALGGVFGPFGWVAIWLGPGLLDWLARTAEDDDGGAW